LHFFENTFEIYRDYRFKISNVLSMVQSTQNTQSLDLNCEVTISLLGFPVHWCEVMYYGLAKCTDYNLYGSFSHENNGSFCGLRNTGGFLK